MTGPRGIGPRILEMLSQGYTHAAIVRALGCSKSAVSFHAQKLGPRRRGLRPSYSWADVPSHYDTGNDLTACIERFGFSRAAWSKAIERGAIQPRERAIPLALLLSNERKTRRTHLKVRLITAGFLRPECAECGLSRWRGQVLSLEMDHVNGNRDDNRLENLRLLCLNCHSLTETYAGRNKRLRLLMQRAVG
jgi:5-methylcytosine-specific restriction endonuclease McrA